MRERAGSPTFRHLARQAHFSVSTLAEATAGRRLPSDQVVRALAAACGEVPDQWSARLAEAARPTQPVTDEAVSPTAVDSAPDRPESSRRGHRLWWAAAALALFTAGGASGLALAGTDSTPPAAQPSPHQPAPTADDGSDPVAAQCTGDAQLIDKAPVTESGVVVGALELKFSPRCDAGWARIYLYPEGVADGLSASLAAVTVTAADGTSSGFAFRLRAQQPAYTDVIMPHGGCLRATATITPAGSPPLAAAIPCTAVPVTPAT